MPATPAATRTSETSSQNPYVFLVGSPRSGTTLLRRMVDAHPEIAITRETHWIVRYYRKRRGLTPDGFVTPELVPALFEYHRFPQMKAKRHHLEKLIRSDRPPSYACFVSAIFDHYGERKRKRLVGDKTPEYIRHLPILHALWPSARFVHIVRDGRDVCLSMLKWRMADRAAGSFSSWEEDPVVTTAFWWRCLVQRGREDGSPLGAELYHELSYASLVASPEEQCRGVCAFLGLVYNDAMLRYHEGREVERSGLSTNASWLPPTEGLRDWRSQMPATDVERFEAAAGDLLEELGLERRFPRPSPPAREKAARIREAFSEEALARDWHLPQLW